MAKTTETRQRLIETARRLFWLQGYAATGIAQVVKEAKARPGSLYYFFPAKEELLLAVLEQYKGMLEPFVVRPVWEQISDPIERVFGILDGYRRQLLETKFQHGCPIGSLALEVGNDIPRARQAIAENFDLWRDAIKRCFEDAKERMPPGVDTSGLALFCLTAMEGAVMVARTYRTIEPYDAAVGMLRDYVNRLVRDPDARAVESGGLPRKSEENHP